MNEPVQRAPTNDSPLVSILIPFLDEEEYLPRCLRSIQAQIYPRDRIEIIAADGGSSDGSRAVIERFRADDPRIAWVANPQRTAAAGLNASLSIARGEIILRVDAHSLIHPDYVERCVAILAERTEIGAIGGILQPVGETPAGVAIAAALQSPFSMGWSPSRYRNEAGDTDTVYLGAYRRHDIEAISGYHAGLQANEDYELNYRLRVAGRKIWCVPDIRSETFTRRSLGALAHQYVRYGYWKARMISLHPGSIMPRHLAAPAALALLILAMVAAALSVTAPVIALCGGYAAGNLYFSWKSRAFAPGPIKLLIPIVFAIMHLCWAAGFWAGLLAAIFAAIRERLLTLRH